MSALTRRDLVLQISNETGLRQKDVEAVMERTMEIITDALAEGRHVELRKFGTFEVKLSSPRTGRDPRNPSRVFAIPARATVRFRTGKVMGERIAKLAPALKRKAE